MTRGRVPRPVFRALLAIRVEILPLAMAFTSIAAHAQDSTKIDSSSAARIKAKPSAGEAGPGYPVDPTTIINMSGLTRTPQLSGYIAARGDRLDGETGFSIYLARLAVVTAPTPFLAVRVQADFSSGQTGRLRSDSTLSGFSLTDAYVQLVLPPKLAPKGSTFDRLDPSMIVGQFITPFSLEYLSPTAMLKTFGLAQADTRLAPKRDIGAQANVGWNRLVTLSAALVNGAGPNATSNDDRGVMVLSRLTVTPLPWLEAAGKIERQETDHAWGFDARAVWRGFTLEGEDIHRKRPTTETVFTDGGGGYVLVAYKLTKWLEPVYKYDRYYDTRFTYVNQSTTTVARSSDTWNIIGVNILTSPEWLRVQLDYNRRNEKPAPGRTNEFVAQVVAIF